MRHQGDGIYFEFLKGPQIAQLRCDADFHGLKGTPRTKIRVNL
jgi:hypothetical protein